MTGSGYALKEAAAEGIMPEFSTQTGGTYFEDEDIAWAYDAVSDTLNDEQLLTCTYLTA